MLVLCRKIGEKVIIDNEIIVTVVAREEDFAIIRIEADKDFSFKSDRIECDLNYCSFHTKVSEIIWINDEIKMMVTGMRLNGAFLGFEAPRHIIINREGVN